MVFVFDRRRKYDEYTVINMQIALRCDYEKVLSQPLILHDLLKW